MLRILRRKSDSRQLAPLYAALRVQLAAYAKKAPDEGKEANQKTQLLLKVLEPAPEPDFEMSPEDKLEWEKRAKEYSRRCMQEHKAWQKALTTRLKLKEAAIEALPTEQLRFAARIESLELFPLDRQIFTDTPPKLEPEKKEEEKEEPRKVRLGTKYG